MRELLSFTAAIVCISTPALAQEPADTVNAFMAAFNAQDGEAMGVHVMEGATFGLIEEGEGEDRTAIRLLSKLVEATANAPEQRSEPIWNLRTLQDGPVASVFADYEFRIAGKRSHCGVNVYNLMRVDGVWKIAGIMYSDMKQGCEGPPAP